jgi:hypothetical protein
LRNLYDQAQVGSNHVGAGFTVAILDTLGEVDFLLNRQKGRSGDFPEI